MSSRALPALAVRQWPGAKAATGAVSVGLLFVLWYAATRWQWLPEGFVPPMTDVWRATTHLARTGELWSNLVATLRASFWGLAAGLLIGVPTGLLMATSGRFERIVAPVVRSTYALPKTTLIPLLVLWFGVGGMTNIVVIAVTTTLPLIVYTLRGAHEVPHVLLWSARSLGTSRTGLLWRVVLPGAMPQILTGVRVAFGFTLLVAISCEMIVANQGIGKLISQYGDQGSYDYLFAALLATTVIAYLADLTLRKVSQFWLRWHETTQHHD
ncbi:Putative aliphatic sulfonates transport permease protein SsuC [Pandoraea pneumonica]|uniref:Aliphatic sulfonates transport permease protein SsuC n=1 Tax=Pandoraea pneumonica TaxID=2508299 RepID=A0A5E4S6U0_9BURK|nr:ABC transporter permease [Pandoraea pneumonica]VVD71290.1 Putative aliphatic sulfonates transport permease protein SsuC [Pandoraea pneumonica]